MIVAKALVFDDIPEQFAFAFLLEHYHTLTDIVDDVLVALVGSD